MCRPKNLRRRFSACVRGELRLPEGILRLCKGIIKCNTEYHSVL